MTFLFTSSCPVDLIRSKSNDTKESKLHSWPSRQYVSSVGRAKHQVHCTSVECLCIDLRMPIVRHACENVKIKYGHYIGKCKRALPHFIFQLHLSMCSFVQSGRGSHLHPVQVMIVCAKVSSSNNPHNIEEKLSLQKIKTKKFIVALNCFIDLATSTDILRPASHLYFMCIIQHRHRQNKSKPKSFLYARCLLIKKIKVISLSM